MEVYMKLFTLVIFCLTLPGMLSLQCNRCERCSSAETNSSAVCKCDHYCPLFDDCCCEVSSQSSFSDSSSSLLHEGLSLSCQSVYTNPKVPIIAENEAFLMVSSCPTSWIDPANTTVKYICTEGSRDLPPVTDVATGLIYRNEYCALCNQVFDLIVWTNQLICREIIYQLIQTDMLGKVLLKDSDILKRECSVCFFSPPLIVNVTTLPTRSCIPTINSCLPHRDLEILINKNMSDESYASLVSGCHSGNRDLVTIRGTVYRNRECAICHGKSLSRATCFELSTRVIELPNSKICQVPEIITEAPTKVLTTEATTEITISTKPDPREEEDRRIPPREVANRIPNAARPAPALPFTVTLSNLGNGQVMVSSGRETTTVSITCPEGEFPVGVECRPAYCPEGYSLLEGRCSYVNVFVNSSVVFNSTNDNNFTNCSSPLVIVNNETYTDFLNDTIFIFQLRQILEVLDYDEFGNPIICGTINRAGLPINCKSAFVTLKESDYEDLNNGSILVQNKVIKVTNRTKDGRPYVCPDLISPFHIKRLLFIEEVPGIQELTYIGSFLSFGGAAAILLTYLIFKELRTFPGIVLMNLCTAVLIINTLFLIGGPAVQYQPSISLCSTFAILLHYFYLAQFSWMSIFSFETTGGFFQVRRLIQKSKKEKLKWLLGYVIVGWVFPLTISIIAIILNYTTTLIQYGVDEHGEIARCWINHYNSSIIMFLVPLVLSLTINLILLIFTTIFLCKAYKDQLKMEKSNISTMLRVWLAIFTTTGLTWTFGFLAISKEELSWMWYPFVVFNSTVGFTMFLTFIFTRKVFNLYRGLMKKFTSSYQTKPKKRITRNPTQKSRLELVPRENSCTSLDSTKAELTTII